MKTAVIQISDEGKRIAALLCSAMPAERITRSDVDKRWADTDALVFIGAMGICVRTIAPYVSDKHTDPAVVCVDSMGRNAVAVLSGHVGGANDLARRIAAITGAAAVITTQSDLAGLWALDTLGQRFGWQLADSTAEPCRRGRDTMQQAVIAFVNRQPTALLLETSDEGTDYLLATLPPHVTVVKSIDEMETDSYRLCIIVSPAPHRLPTSSALVLHFVPRVLTAGIGLAHQAGPAADVIADIRRSIAAAGYHPLAVGRYCTIDVKRDEPVVRALQASGESVGFFTAEELSAVEVPHPSATVQKHVGTPSVCEAAAILGSRGGELAVAKMKGSVWTVALAATPPRKGFIEIVGAGPGDPGLISVRGRSMLERADLILYAGSLVPKALTECHKPGAVVRSSADMALEEQCALMKEHYDKGHFIVRLHTGDPCIFGAIQEQMAFFDANGMDYHITPGISSFLAAAAELRSQFTIPERTQTIILTRGEGRTPMPEREKLHLLARSQSTMCIFLSAAIVDDVQRELLEEYPADTPVAACYHLTWPDQRIYRGRLKDLARMVHDNHLTLTTMLVVGEAIDNRRGLSELYNRHFTHLYRKGEQP